MNFVLYDRDGRIAQNGYMGLEDFETMNIPEGLSFLQGIGAEETHYVSKGKIVPYTDMELITIRTKASGWEWKLPERKLVDMRSIVTVREMVWDRIKKEKAALEAAPFEFEGNVYDSNLPAILQAATVASFSSNYMVNWTLKNNTSVTLTGSQIMRLAAALGQRKNDIHQEAQRLRERIDYSLNIAQMDQLRMIYFPQ